MLIRIIDEIIAALCALLVLTQLNNETTLNLGIVMVTGLLIWLVKIVFLMDVDQETSINEMLPM